MAGARRCGKIGRGKGWGENLNGEEISHSQPKSSRDGDKFWPSGSLSRSDRWSGNTGNIRGEKGQMKNKTRRGEKKNKQAKKKRGE